uniref:tetratricopeptide repeat protein n=1 Tax=Nitrosomonas sp. TaxID=42353 RepID=UPI0025D2A0E0
LNNLGLLLANDRMHWPEAEKYYCEALAIYRKLAEKDPDSYQSDLARVLSNLGFLLAKDSTRQDEAEKYYREVLVIGRELAK